jgi:hypothetical protein
VQVHAAVGAGTASRTGVCRELPGKDVALLGISLAVLGEGLARITSR